MNVAILLSDRPLAELLFEQVDGELVGGHHDGRVGDLADQLGAQPPVQPHPPLLPLHQSERLPEGLVLGP